jgi:hypothetical protein
VIAASIAVVATRGQSAASRTKRSICINGLGSGEYDGIAVAPRNIQLLHHQAATLEHSQWLALGVDLNRIASFGPTTALTPTTEPQWVDAIRRLAADCGNGHPAG